MNKTILNEKIKKNESDIRSTRFSLKQTDLTKTRIFKEMSLATIYDKRKQSVQMASSAALTMNTATKEQIKNAIEKIQ